MTPFHDGIDAEGALKRLGHSRTLYSTLIGRFAADGPPVFADLARHVEAGNWKEAGICLHTLKGMAATVGATAIAAAAADMERDYLDNGHIDNAAGRLVRLNQVLLSSIDALREVAGTLR